MWWLWKMKKWIHGMPSPSEISVLPLDISPPPSPKFFLTSLTTYLSMASSISLNLYLWPSVCLLSESGLERTVSPPPSLSWSISPCDCFGPIRGVIRYPSWFVPQENLKILDSRLSQNSFKKKEWVAPPPPKKNQVSSISTLVVTIYFPCSHGSFIAYLLWAVSAG